MHALISSFFHPAHYGIPIALYHRRQHDAISHKLKLQLPTYTEENIKCKSTTVGLLAFLLVTGSRNKPTKDAVDFGYVCVWLGTGLVYVRWHRTFSKLSIKCFANSRARMKVSTVYKSKCTVTTLASSRINTVSVTHITHFIGVGEQRTANLRDCGTLSPHFTLKLWITYYQF